MFIQINLKISFRYTTSFYVIEWCIFDLFLLYTYIYVYTYKPLESQTDQLHPLLITLITLYN